MLLRCKCPGCGRLKEYIAEEAGSAADCFDCGQRFLLKPNKGRAALQIISATLAVLLILGGIGARLYLRAWRNESRQQAFDAAVQRQKEMQSALEKMQENAPAADRDDN